jgi:hypothetical protein
VMSLRRHNLDAIVVRFATRLAHKAGLIPIRIMQYSPPSTI